MAVPLTADSPLALRLLAWSSERFPLAQAPLLLVFYGAALLFGRFLAGEAPLALRPGDALGFLAAWSFFLLLRIFDEHKDYALDALNHPQRVLQKGLITLSHLKVAGALAVAVQAGVSLGLDGGVGPITTRWLLTLTWSLLMAWEFFCGAWLRPRLVLYAFSHMLVMPLALVWMASIGAAPMVLSPRVWALALLSFLSGAALEVTRKSWAPAEERDTIDSYSQAFGVSAAPLVIVGLLAASFSVQFVILRWVLSGQAAWPWLAAAFVLVLAPAAVVLHFRRTPTVAGRKRNEAAVGLHVLVGNVLIACALVAARGLRW